MSGVDRFEEKRDQFEREARVMVGLEGGHRIDARGVRHRVARERFADGARAVADVPRATDVVRVVGEVVVETVAADVVVRSEYVTARRVDRGRPLVVRHEALRRIRGAGGLVGETVGVDRNREATEARAVEQQARIGTRSPRNARAGACASERRATRGRGVPRVVDVAGAITGDEVLREADEASLCRVDLADVVCARELTQPHRYVGDVEAGVVERHRADVTVAVDVSRNHEVALDLHDRFAAPGVVMRVAGRPSIEAIQRPSNVVQCAHISVRPTELSEGTFAMS